MLYKTKKKYNKTKERIMKLSDINPHIRYASTHYYHAPKDLDSICYDCRLFFIKEGKGYVVANGSEYQFKSNSVLYFPSGTTYHFYPDKGCSQFVSVVINFDLVNTFCDKVKSLGTASINNYIPEKQVVYPMPKEFATIISKKVPSVAPLLEKCCEEFLLHNPMYRETASALLKLCLIDIIKNVENNQDNDRIHPIINYIHENYFDTSLSNESIAELFNYHPYYLSQMVREHTGLSLHQYLISYRIKMAKKKLLTTNDSINTIAWKSGFSSTAYFIKQFKSKTGMTPNTYRKARIDSLF